MNERLIEALTKKGYIKLARFEGVEASDMEQFLEAARVSPNYTDHALIVDDQNKGAVIYARKLRGAVTTSLYRSAIVERLDKQTDKGLAKYGKLLHDNKLNAVARLEYLAEELTDGLQYIEHAKVGLHEVFDELAGLISRIMMVAARSVEIDDRDELSDIAREANRLLGKVMGYEDNEQGREENPR